MDIDRIEIYQGRGLRKGLRWRYIAAGNNARLANGGEAYSSTDDLFATLIRVCGLPPMRSPWGSWREVSDQKWRVTRDNGDVVIVEVTS